MSVSIILPGNRSIIIIVFSISAFFEWQANLSSSYFLCSVLQKAPITVFSTSWSLFFSFGLLLHVPDAQRCNVTSLTQDIQHRISAAASASVFCNLLKRVSPLLGLTLTLQWMPSRISRSVCLFHVCTSYRSHSVLCSLDRAVFIEGDGAGCRTVPR